MTNISGGGKYGGTYVVIRPEFHVTAYGINPIASMEYAENRGFCCEHDGSDLGFEDGNLCQDMRGACISGTGEFLHIAQKSKTKDV